MFDFVTDEYISSVTLKNNKIVKGLPKTMAPIDRYIRRIVHFYSGINSHMPMTADFDLKDYCNSVGVEFRYVGEQSSKIRKEIDNKIFEWCRKRGLLSGAKQWVDALS